MNAVPRIKPNTVPTWLDAVAAAAVAVVAAVVVVETVAAETAVPTRQFTDRTLVAEAVAAVVAAVADVVVAGEMGTVVVVLD